MAIKAAGWNVAGVAGYKAKTFGLILKRKRGSRSVTEAS